MKTKSAYRQKPAAEPNVIPVIDEPAPDLHQGTTQDLDLAQRAQEAEEIRQREASTRLREQIEAMQRAEDSQRERLQQAQRPMSQEEQAQAIMAHAVQIALHQGHEPNSEAHQRAAFRIFHAMIGTPEQVHQHQQPQYQQPEPEPPPMPTPTRQQIAEELAPMSSPDERRAAMVSAPVSRETPTGGGYGQRYQSRSSQVTLTPEEREMCRMTGVSEVDYAKGKKRLQSEIAAGSRQNG
jgi:hypothetical protein